MKKLNYLIVSVVILFFPFLSKAAVLYIDPATGTFGPNERFIAKIKIDNQGECVNAMDIGVTFSDNLKMIDFTTGNSIINLWITKPDSSNMSKINLQKGFSFSGGIPGGYCGPISGDSGESNILGEAVFTTQTANEMQSASSSLADVSFKSDPQVLLNDGKGTAAKVITRNAKISLVASKKPSPDEWNQRLRDDDVPPETFTIELDKNPNIYEGKYYIIFSTVDKQTGVDHYEVLEIEPGKQLSDDANKSIMDKIFGAKKPQWIVAQSPYVLEDQSLQSDIQVKAIDKAGNERIVKYFPKEGEQPRSKRISLLYPFMVILIIIIGTALIFFVYEAYKKYKKTRS